MSKASVAGKANKAANAASAAKAANAVNAANTANVKLIAFEQEIGHVFSDIALLTQALTHSSYANEMNAVNVVGTVAPGRLTAKSANTANAANANNVANTANTVGTVAPDRPHANVAHNEKLEFLGDAILGFVVAEELYKKRPGDSEGNLSRKRAAVVCEPSLARCARGLGVDRLMKFGGNVKGEPGRKRDSMLSDAMEAVFAAVYLDGGIEAARAVIVRCLGASIGEALDITFALDHKTRLQEYFFARDKDVKIVYSVTEESGPAHKRRFTSQVSVNGSVLGVGAGGTKKESEQNAAKEALDSIP
ncbi:MAG: ribonuclease III [Oscillospiraceae bacterium]|nr:ribonuclease III [Oscillospiraceae bacterium]